ncbi:MAG: hypothetical protein J1F67_06955 [Muribaculaceae bacterium]|nr:hypothetical protein [Muribaculaceae bacterium]
MQISYNNSSNNLKLGVVLQDFAGEICSVFTDEVNNKMYITFMIGSPLESPQKFLMSEINNKELQDFINNRSDLKHIFRNKKLWWFSQDSFTKKIQISECKELPQDENLEAFNEFDPDLLPSNEKVGFEIMQYY